jgi:hypothetical protein
MAILFSDISFSFSWPDDVSMTKGGITATCTAKRIRCLLIKFSIKHGVRVVSISQGCLRRVLYPLPLQILKLDCDLTSSSSSVKWHRQEPCTRCRTHGWSHRCFYMDRRRGRPKQQRRVAPGMSPLYIYIATFDSCLEELWEPCPTPIGHACSSFLVLEPSCPPLS